MLIALICEAPERADALDSIASRWGLTHDDNALFALVLTASQLELRKRDEPKLGAVFVDLVGGAVGHRRKFGGGKGQSIAKPSASTKGQRQPCWMPLPVLAAMRLFSHPSAVR